MDIQNLSTLTEQADTKAAEEARELTVAELEQIGGGAVRARAVEPTPSAFRLR